MKTLISKLDNSRPLIIAFVIILITIASLVFLVTTSLDKKDNASKQQTLQASLKFLQNSLERQSLTFAWWDEAIEEAVEKQNMTWIQNNLGEFVAQIHDISSCFVVDVDGTTLAGFIEGEFTKTDAFEYVGKSLEKLIASVFDTNIKISPDAPLEAFITASDFFLIDAIPHIVTICAFTPETMPPELLRSNVRPVLVFSQAINPKTVALISAITQIKDLKLLPSTVFIKESSQEIKNRDGKIIAMLSWQAPSYGRNLLKILLPMVAFALIAVIWFTRMSFKKELSLRKEAEEELHKVNEGLEKRVLERTNQLMHTNASLLDEISLRKSVEKEILVISEREQRNVGQDIHDGLCQQLTGVLCHIGIAEKKMVRLKTIDPTALVEISDLIKETLESAYNMSKGLCPLSLDPASLASSLYQLTVKTQQLFGVQCAFETVGNPVLNDSVTALQLYRIAQEALNNAAKHSMASKILLHLKRDEHTIHVLVEDDGKGFNKDQISKQSMGLKIMEYRASIINGRLSIDTNEDGGTLVSCAISLNDDQQNDPKMDGTP